MVASGIGSAVGGLVGGGLIAAGAGGKGGDKQYKAALKLWQKLQTANFDYRALDPPELQLLGELSPELYQAVVPETFQQVADSSARTNQATALGQMEEIAGEGIPTADRLSNLEASRAVTGAASASRLDALRSLASRGALGAGDEIQAQIAGNASASNLARDLGSDAARQAALRRLSAIGAAGSMAGQLRAGDVDINTRNADIANRFSELWSRMGTEQAASNAATKNAAQAANVESRQRIGDTNTLNRYNVELSNLERANELKDRLFGQQLARTSGLAGAYNTRGLQKDQDKAAREASIMSTSQGVGGLLGGLL